MKGCRRILTLALVLGGCAHTRSTEDGSEKQPRSERSQTKPSNTSGAAGGEPSHLRSGAEGIPVASSPGGLLAPGGEEQIRERLVKDGFIPHDAAPANVSMRDGLRRFQKAHDLPATGVPDQATIEGLGLDPDRVLRRGTVKD